MSGDGYEGWLRTPRGRRAKAEFQRAFRIEEKRRKRERDEYFADGAERDRDRIVRDQYTMPDATEPLAGVRESEIARAYDFAKDGDREAVEFLRQAALYLHAEGLTSLAMGEAARALILGEIGGASSGRPPKPASDEQRALAAETLCTVYSMSKTKATATLARWFSVTEAAIRQAIDR